MVAWHWHRLPRASVLGALSLVSLVSLPSSSAHAQQPLPSLPPSNEPPDGKLAPPPPPGPPPAHAAPAPDLSPADPSQPTMPPQNVQPAPLPPPYGQSYGSTPGFGQPPPNAGQDDDESHYYAPRPPPFEYEEAPPPPVHAPKFALYAGARLSLIGFGGRFYNNELGNDETTGNFIKNGLALEVDVGARLGKRYLPYIFYEYGGMGAGHRFDGESASAHTDFIGAGFRYIAGDVNSAGFLTDLALGVRTIVVSSGGQTYKMSAFELFRLGLGAEVRLTSYFTISPMAFVSGGAMSDTSGNVQFSQTASKDGLTQPTYRNGASIQDETTYWVVGVGCGGHFDLFGK